MKPRSNSIFICSGSLKRFALKAEAGICVLLVLGSAVKCGLAQRYNPYRSHSNQYRNVWSNPQRQYQFLPALSSPGGLGLAGGRIVDAVKAQPTIHYSNVISGASHFPFASASTNQLSSPYYSGYQYVGEKHNSQPKIRQPSHSVSSTMYSPSTYFSPSHSQPTFTTYKPSSSVSYEQPFAPPPSYPYHQLPPTTRGPLTSASMDTYREALDLFSEVVGKLEKETGGAFGVYQPPNYLQSSPVTNGIYGSIGRFPHHLDHIMGPDFLQRAHKLYSKIIKEQNYGRESSPSYYTSPVSVSRGYPTNGLSYFENRIKPSSSSPVSSTTSYGYANPSPYDRSMVLNRVTPDSPLERSLVDTVTALEMNLGKHGSQGEPTLADEMETSESRVVPFLHNHAAVVQSKPPTTSPPVPSVPTNLASHPWETTFGQVNPVIPSVAPHTIPLNENDFIEHPLPFHEYEELVRDIAANHNY